ncbi:MAG: tRNA 2-thiouridine(34) synthase MnmA [Candidatus Aminicenantes bacterium]
MKKQILVAMSGGVDSTMAAAVLKESGYDVTGVTFILVEGMDGAAARAAEKLGVRHYDLDLKKTFEKEVIQDFIRKYKHGRTPNPCIRCNRFVKFELLLEEARRLGIPRIATGHYARVSRDPESGRILLKKGSDPRKDQSYFLYSLTQDQLSAVLFPLGEMSKSMVRRKAEKMGFSGSGISESQEICFVTGKDYVGFLKSRIPEAFVPGDILDFQGKILGKHPGIAGFTIGQRRGMGVASEQPLYVLSINPEKQSIVVGPAEHLYQKKVTAEAVNWVSRPAGKRPVPVSAQIRYNQKPQPALLIPGEKDSFRVHFKQPQRAVTPGQAVVCYQGPQVTAGGTIVKGEN